MISKNIVIILGAGASIPYGFPAGSDLKDAIENRTYIAKIHDLFESLGITQHEAHEFQTYLRDSKLGSVDAFLENNKKYETIGKAFIAHTLIEKESDVALYKRNNQDDWFQYLFGLMMNNEKVEDFQNNKVSFITYNYDRSLEQMLDRALRACIYDKNLADALYQSVPIVHLHGQLGLLKGADKSTVRDYTPELTGPKLAIAMNGIRIIYEGDENSKDFETARNMLAGARTIIFLGFGYNEVNIRRLHFERLDSTDIQIFGTCFGLTESEIIHRVHKFFRRTISISQLDRKYLSREFLRHRLELFS
jgi:hypothetical protein